MTLPSSISQNRQGSLPTSFTSSLSPYFVSGQSLSDVQLLATSWTAADQASLSFPISCNLLKLMSIESVMPSNYLILCHSLLLLPSIFPSIRVFFNGSSNQVAKIWASASASVLPMNIQDWFPLGLMGLISLLSNGLSRVFSSTTIWKHQKYLTKVLNC